MKIIMRRIDLFLIWSCSFGVIHGRGFDGGFDGGFDQLNPHQEKLTWNDNPSSSSAIYSSNSLREHDDEDNEDNEDEGEDDVGLLLQGNQERDSTVNEEEEEEIWRVLDLGSQWKNDSRNCSNVDRHYHHHFLDSEVPACLMAQIQMKFNFPGQLDRGSFNVSVPQKSSQINGTCGTSNQSLRVTWSPSPSSRMDEESLDRSLPSYESHVTLYFIKNAVNITLDRISASIFVHPPHRLPAQGEEIQKLLQYNLNSVNPRNESLLQAPHRYCYTCGLTFAIPMKVQDIQVHSLYDDDVSNSSLLSVHEEIFLLFESIKVEPFRSNPNSDGFTHLKWDCQTYWMLPYIPILVAVALLILVICMVLAFCFREAMGFKVERPHQSKNPYKPI